MKPLTPGDYAHLKAAAYRYVSIVDVKNTGSHTVLVIKPFRNMNEADTRSSIMGIGDSIIADTVHGNKHGFAIEYELHP